MSELLFRLALTITSFLRFDKQKVSAKELKDVLSIYVHYFGKPSKDTFLWFTLLKFRTLFIQKDRNCVIGYILFVPTARNTLHIKSVAIHPDHQGKGIGKILMERTLKGLPSFVRKITLDVDLNNSSAHKLYFSLGFSILKTDDKGMFMQLEL